MTAGSPNERTTMGDLCAARSRLDAVLGSVADESDLGAPLEFEVLDPPAFDAQQSVAVRDRAATYDLALRIETMARRAPQLRRRLEVEARAEADDDIDLREGPTDVIDLDAEQTISCDGAMAGIVAAVRALSERRDAGLVSNDEFDAAMTRLLSKA